MNGIIIILLLFALMLTGMPISISLGLTVLTFLFTMSDVPLQSVAMKLFTGIEKFEIILPSLDKQKEVVEKMSKIDEEISKAKQYVANAYSAKQAILDKYLK